MFGLSLFSREDSTTNHLQTQNLALEARVADLEAELSELHQEREGLQQELERMVLRMELADGLYRNFRYFSDSLVQLQTTLAQLANNLREEKSSAIEAAEVSVRAREGTSKMVSSLQQVVGSVGDAAGHVANLNERASAIGSIVSLINEVSDQTNLLALNAAIEAARAGDHGRGFAVVADEVRNLSRRTSSATKEIAAEINKIQEETSCAQVKMTEMAKDSDALGDIGRKASDGMGAVLSLSKKMEGAISAGALRSFVELAKADHLRFKFEIYQVMMGILSKAPEEFASHTTCRLGNWYYQGEGHECFSQLSGYEEMEQPHQEVHERGVEALRHYHAGDIKKALAELKAMEQASIGVQAALERMATAGEQDNSLLCHGGNH